VAAVSQLTAKLHGAPAGWRLDALATLAAPAAGASGPVVSSAQVPVLGYGRGAASAGPWLVPATSAGSRAPASSASASGLAASRAVLGSAALASGAALAASASAPGWRMIVQLSPDDGGVTAEGIYPGGQDENPAGLWHDDLTARWQAGGYLLLAPAGGAVTGPARWEFLP